MYDLLIKNGDVLDPGQGLKGRQDIAITGGKIEQVAPDIDPKQARRVVDVGDKLVTPGLIDLHAHVYRGVATVGVNENSAPPDLVGVQAGVTTVVDAGSAGSHCFDGLVNYVVPTSRTRLFALLHICRTGLLTMPEPADHQAIDLEATIRTIETNKPLVKGVKLRMVSPLIDVLGLEAVRLAIQAARETDTFLMVHIGDTTQPPSSAAPAVTRDMLELLRPGDVVTHLFTPRPGGMLDGDGKVVPELLEARERGVVLDGSQGRPNFSFEVARRLLDLGIAPDIIGTDIGSASRVDVIYSLTECMCKFLALGLSVEDVVRMTTANPARVLGASDTLGAIAVGRQADLSVLEVAEGDWALTDFYGRTEQSEKALAPLLTVRAGEVITPDWGPHPWGWLPAPGPNGRKAASDF